MTQPSRGAAQSNRADCRDQLVLCVPLSGPPHPSVLLAWRPHQAAPPGLPPGSPAQAEEEFQRPAAAWVPAVQSTGLVASPPPGQAAAWLLHREPVAATGARPAVLSSPALASNSYICLRHRVRSKLIGSGASSILEPNHQSSGWHKHKSVHCWSAAFRANRSVCVHYYHDPWLRHVWLSEHAPSWDGVKMHICDEHACCVAPSKSQASSACRGPGRDGWGGRSAVKL